MEQFLAVKSLQLHGSYWVILALYKYRNGDKELDSNNQKDFNLKKDVCGTMVLDIDDTAPGPVFHSQDYVENSFDYCEPEPTFDNCCIQGFLCEAREDYVPSM